MGSKKKTNHPHDNERLLLDSFSDLDLARWNKLSGKLEEYEVRLHHHLESQRVLNKDRLTQALNSGKTLDNYARDGLFRIVDYKYSDTPLSTIGKPLSSNG